jgi:hypothetical protein
MALFLLSQVLNGKSYYYGRLCEFAPAAASTVNFLGIQRKAWIEPSKKL